MMKELRSKGGFTLIEVIVVIVLVAMLGAVVYTFLGSSLARTVNPVILVKDQNRLIDVMEKIVADYRDRIEQGTLNLGTFPNDVRAYLDTDVTFSPDPPVYLEFTDNDNNGIYDESPCTYGSEGCRTLRITLSKGDQKTSNLFTE